MTTTTRTIRDFADRQVAWFAEQVAPPIADLWERLDVPEYRIYKDALRDFSRDSWEALKSTYRLLFLTLRPICILLWIILQFLWRNLLEHGGRSLQHGFQQLKYASVVFWKFQRSLSRTELLGEAGIVATLVAAYYFRKWLKRQTYWARTVRWYRGKKEQMVQACTRAVHKVAHTSKVLAMALPHLVFLGWCVSVRIFFPSVVRWLAHDTIFTLVLSVVYPLFKTLVWIHARRHPEKNGKEKVELADEGTHEESAKPSTLRRRKNTTISKTRDSSTTNANVPAAYSQANLASTRNGAAHAAIASDTESPQSNVMYWLRYWQVYAMVQAVAQLFVMAPIFGRIVMRRPFFSLLGGEMKLLFFVWLFGMERILANPSKDAFLAQVLPLNLIKRHVTPLLLWLHEQVSDFVSSERWDTWVVSKAKNILSGFVFIKMLSEGTKDWLVHVLEEARAVIIPAVTLLMPGFVTAFGVAYVQFIIPSAKSAQAKGDAAKLVYLQYWVLNCALSGLLTWFSGILWWIPFSTHAIFVLWAYMSFPQTIRTYYDVLESELIAFGLMKGSGNSVGINNTKTARLISSIAGRLPSASQDEHDERTENSLKASDSEESVPNLGAKTSQTEPDIPESPRTSSVRRSTRSSTSKQNRVG